MHDICFKGPHQVLENNQICWWYKTEIKLNSRYLFDKIIGEEKKLAYQGIWVLSNTHTK